MRSVAVPDSDLPALSRSVAACIACILELESADVPAPDAGHPQPWTVWSNWLAERGLGLVPVSDPLHFGWPGPWIAVLRSDATSGPVAAVAFGSPPDLAWSPLAGSPAFAKVEAGYVVAATDLAGWTPPPTSRRRERGLVELLALAGEAAGAMSVVTRVDARRGRGLVGDRYFDGLGTFSNAHATGVDLTLIEAEALDSLELASGRLDAAQARRNVVTRGVDLNALVGRRFRVGEVECIGRRLCEPCAHLQRLTLPGTLRGLAHRGGLRADLLTDGTITVGDPVVAA